MKAGALYRNGACLIPRVWRADRTGSRLRGLLGQRPLEGDAAEALLIVPCNSVHTFGMRYALDIVFLDADQRVLGWRGHLRPWRFAARAHARYTLELAAGGLERLQPRRGEQWEWRIPPDTRAGADERAALSTAACPLGDGPSIRWTSAQQTSHRRSDAGRNPASLAHRFRAGENRGLGIGHVPPLPQTASSAGGEGWGEGAIALGSAVEAAAPVLPVRNAALATGRAASPGCHSGASAGCVGAGARNLASFAHAFPFASSAANGSRGMNGLPPDTNYTARIRRLPFLACLAFAILAGCATTSPAVRLRNLTATQQQADTAYAHHDWRAAAVRYHALTQAVPGNAAYWFRLGNSYARLDQPQPAADAYRAALQRNPHLAPAWHNLGSVLLKQAQAAYVEAADNAQSSDPLQSKSALRAARIRDLRGGASQSIPAAPSKGQADTPRFGDGHATPTGHAARIRVLRAGASGHSAADAPTSTPHASRTHGQQATGHQAAQNGPGIPASAHTQHGEGP